MSPIAKSLLLVGALLMLAGAAVWGAERLGITLGRLPGDLSWRGKNGSVHFPVMTSLLVSVVLTLLLNLWLRGRQ
jgi:hypothetical protein